MCNLAIVLQKKPGNVEAKHLLSGQYGLIASQPDGICSLAVKDDVSVSVERKLEKDKYAGVFNKALDSMKESRLVAVHSRIASVGNVSNENVHFFEHDGRYFAHNGHVSDYMKTYTSVYSYKAGAWDKSEKKQNYFTLSAKGLKKALRKKNDKDLFVERETVNERINRITNAVECCLVCSNGVTCKEHESVADETLALEALLASGKLDRITLLPDIEVPPTQQRLADVSARIFDTEGVQAGAVRPITTDPSDSLQFLQNLPKELSIESLDKYSKDKGFSGVALLVDKKQSKAWIMTTRQCDVHTDGDYLIVYSFKPNTKFDAWRYVMGVPVVNEDATQYKTETLYAGTYELDLRALASGQDDIVLSYT